MRLYGLLTGQPFQRFPPEKAAPELTKGGQKVTFLAAKMPTAATPMTPPMAAVHVPTDVEASVLWCIGAEDLDIFPRRACPGLARDNPGKTNQSY